MEQIKSDAKIPLLLLAKIKVKRKNRFKKRINSKKTKEGITIPKGLNLSSGSINRTNKTRNMKVPKK